MNIEIISASEMRTGKGGSGKGKGRYTKYIAAYKKIIPELKEAISDSDDGYIRVKASELARELGKEFTKLHPTSFQWGTKYALFYEGIVVTTGKHSSGEPVLVLRAGTPNDKLPDSLAKGEEEDNGSKSEETEVAPEEEDSEEGRDTKED